MSKNPLNDFGKASCSVLEQDKSASACAEKYSQAINDKQSSERSELESPKENKVLSANDNSLPWWDDKAIEQVQRERTQAGSLKDRQPTFEIGQQIPDLHGFRGIDPANQRKYEKYEHRIIAELKAGGRTNQEICEITGYCASSVASIVKLPWVKQFVMDEIHKHGGQAVVDYMSQHAMPAAETVVSGFMDEEMPRGRDRVAAANSLLDRLFGKANQNITTHKGADLSKVTDEELAAIAQSPQN